MFKIKFEWHRIRNSVIVTLIFSKMEVTEGAKTHAIVEFPDDDNSVGVIPVGWLSVNADFCFYPPKPMKSGKITKLVKKGEEPAENFDMHNVVVKKYFSKL